MKRDVTYPRWIMGMLFVSLGCGSVNSNRNSTGPSLNLAKFDETVFSIDAKATSSGAASPDRGAVEIPFDRSSASDALVAACESVRHCYNGPPVAVVVSTTFEQDGHALDAHVDSPLAVVGSLIASCVEDRFRKVRVHQFSGEPITAGKKCRVGRDVPWDCVYEDCSGIPQQDSPELFLPLR